MAKTERGVMPNDRDSTSILRDDQDLEKVCERVVLFFDEYFSKVAEILNNVRNFKIKIK